MKIWFDLTNSPHVNFFKKMIEELRQDHELVITCRPLANTIELLELFGFPHHIVGSHYGQNKIRKVIGFGIRISQLYGFLRNKGIDVGISHSSFYSPVVSRMLGIKSIYLNDNEHAEGNRVSFLFADKIMVPEFLDMDKLKKQWAREEKIIKYPGLKEGVYLWPYVSEYVKKEKIKVIYIRPEPWTAQYYRGSRNFIDNLLIALKDWYKVILLPRGKVQEQYYKEKKFDGIEVLEKSVTLKEIMDHCDLFIGAGGTMTREAAVLGVPTISIYQDKLLDVDNYLIDHGFLVHQRKLDASFVEGYLAKMERKPPDNLLLDKGKAAYELIKSNLLSEDLADLSASG